MSNVRPIIPQMTKSFARFVKSLYLSLLLTLRNYQTGRQTETSRSGPNVSNVRPMRPKTSQSQFYALRVKKRRNQPTSIRIVCPCGRKTRTFPGKRNVSSVRPCTTPEENTRSVTSGNKHRIRVTLARETCRQTSSTQLLYKSLK